MFDWWRVAKRNACGIEMELNGPGLGWAAVNMVIAISDKTIYKKHAVIIQLAI